MTAVASTALLAAGSFTTVAGLITDSLVAERGWSRGAIGSGVAIGMVLYGVVAPFSAAMTDRFGLRCVTAAALVLLAVAASLTVTAPSVVWFVVWWGVLAGLGTGAVTMVFGATVAQRWFVRRIGLASGILTAASVVGQFAMLPVLSAVMDRVGWRGPVLVCGALAAGAAILVGIVLREHPRDVGVQRYGATADDIAPAREDPLRRTFSVAMACIGSPRFWTLAWMFLLCGATTNGLMWSHFTPAAADHGMPPTAASSLLAVIGVANIAGTVGAGWLTDRVDARAVLAVFFCARGVTLAVLPFALGARVDPALIGFAVGFGLLDVATVPPTLALCRRYFGPDAAVVFGWVNVFHQVGAGLMALLAGLTRDVEGSYTPIWLMAAHLCVCAAILGVLAGRERRVAVVACRS